TYTFNLRKDAVWSDGRPVTATDAVFAFHRALDPSTKAAYTTQIFAIKNAEALFLGKAKPSDLGVIAKDPHTLDIVLTRPQPTLLLLLANLPMIYPLPRHAIEANPQGWARAGSMVSSGAFVLAEWKVGNKVRLTKNARFYDAASVKIDEVHYYPTVDDNTALNLFRAGQLDMNPRFPPNQLPWLRKNLSGQFKIVPALWVTYLVPNIRKAPFSDPRVRRALHLAISRDVLTAKVLRNGEKPYWGIVPDVIENYVSPITPDNRPLPERQTEARSLLSAAGFDPGKPLAFTFSHRAGFHNRLAAVAVASMWADIGVKADLTQADVSAHYDKLRAGNFDIADAGYSDNADPEYFAYLLETKSVEVNYGAYSNKTYDAMVERARAILDRTARFRAFQDAERLAIGENAVIPMFLSVERVLIKPYVKGLEENPLGQYPSRFIRIEGRP
ncbi:MAG TPA: peptide ABC transporter substrate-binding protein, partial [Alphaproteobacteria bacterium]|nr:peptide ABC transporter substrate-binding protein [Alphaproteobacteria bacterium]